MHRMFARASSAAGVLSALAAATLWGANLALTRLGVVGDRGLTPADLALLRFLLPAVALAPALLRLRLPGPAIMAGLLMGGVPFVMLAAAGLARVNAAEAGALLPGAFPVCVALLGSLLGCERIGPSRAAGLALIVASTLLLVGPGRVAGTAGGGHVLLFAAALLSAAQAWALRHAGLPAPQAIALVSAGSTLGFLPLHQLACASRLAEVQASSVALHALLQGGLAGLAGPLLFAVAVHRLGAGRAASFAGLTPIAAAAFGALLLGEAPDGATLLAGIGTAAGVFLANRPAAYVAASRARA